MNRLTVKEGEAIFIPPGVPHAYISGDLVQCMASSDNVLRAGLTVKLKDYSNFCKIVRVEQQSDLQNVIIKGEKIDQTNSIQLFHSNDERFQQFAVFKVKLQDQGQSCQLSHIYLKKSPKILICISGEIKVQQLLHSSQKINNQIHLKQGDVIFITAEINYLSITSKMSQSEAYLASCAFK